MCKLLHFEDRKRALARCARRALPRKPKPALACADCLSGHRSQLLQRAACERALGVPFAAAVLSRTKGGKPFLVRAASCAVLLYAPR